MSSLAPSNINIDKAIAKRFIILSVLTGLIGAFVNPLMSYFIVEGLNSPPAYIGIYTAAVTLSGLVISQWLGKLADDGVNVKKLYLVATFGTVLALCVFIGFGVFGAVLLAGICFMSFGNASIPQMLIIGRQWAGNTSLNVPSFNAKVRASMSFAWMMGPALGFTLVGLFGFYASFSIAIVFALLAMAFMWFGIPNVAVTPNHKALETTSRIPASFWLLSGAVMLGMTANLTYSSALPLYLVKEQKLPEYLPGILMGLVACLEIPVMLYVGKRASKTTKCFAKERTMLIAFIIGVVFYVGMYAAQSLWQFVALQVLNALYYGIYAGLGLTIMQEQLPKRIGFTSSFYSNAMKVGMMVGTTATGLIAQLSSFQAANLGAGAASILAFLCLAIFIQLKKRELKACEK